MLELKNITTGYERRNVLHDISANKYGIFRSEPVLAIVKDSKIVNIEE